MASNGGKGVRYAKAIPKKGKTIKKTWIFKTVCDLTLNLKNAFLKSRIVTYPDGGKIFGSVLSSEGLVWWGKIGEPDMELPLGYGCYRYYRIMASLKREDWKVNYKRVEHLWQREGLNIPKRATEVEAIMAEWRVWCAYASGLRIVCGAMILFQSKRMTDAR